jgi:aminoglycoside phosphotransferase (APT) family kinase protein
MLREVLRPEYWNRYLPQSKSMTAQKLFADHERIKRGFDAKWALDDAARSCLTHGDAHIANIYLDQAGRLFFVDWQMAAMTHWANDVEIFLVGSLSVADRRAHERDLLQHYLTARKRQGAPVLSMDEAWLCYRQRHLAGVTFALTPPEMQPADICDAYAERYAQAAIDHETLDLLGV